jgi:phosphoribosylglycinamide formyltransferase
MIHKVIPAVDKGEPLLTEEVSILETDSLEDLEIRIHSVEHRLIVQGAKKILNQVVHNS